ncbi:hypothetical protein HHK36_025582 [Tetracentron sinense]|uniref:non-specific serine/threonine protein kinase n=1 Tax=Tetracentron sinense TaxID=13715 RepID=A0A834YKQ9_TETSI|nr:hypothetical protein HHK36_025582 [Tetracentron sinense]
MVMLSSFFSVFLGCFVLGPLVHGRQQSGFISIDCGIHEDFSYTDAETRINYSSDKHYIETGINMNISSEFTSNTLQQPLLNVRSFPHGNKICYTLRPEGGKNNKYLIRASFMYGNYDGKDQVPVFDLYLDVNLWDSVTFKNASDVVMKEIIHVATMDYIQVCLVNIGSGTPFISALELRPLTNSSYSVESGSLLLQDRLDIGSTFNKKMRFRYKDDVYDRIWAPFTSDKWDAFNTSLEVHDETIHKVPSTVMSTAVRPITANDPLKIVFSPKDPTSQYYYFMYVAEIEQHQNNQSRKFYIMLNGENATTEPVIPVYLKTNVLYPKRPWVGNPISVSFSKTADSTLPPILNALEIYIIKKFLLLPTDGKDVGAITEIKEIYGRNRYWNGDPCHPTSYSWDGVTCKFDGNKPPIIISLNLSSSGLTGKIADSLANLLSIESLDLSNNCLEGPVPEFLAELPNLRLLNLRGNKLTGPLPPNLIERAQDELHLHVDPYLCTKDTFKKSKKNIIPEVLLVTSVLVLLIALVVLWSLKKRRQQVAKPAVNAKQENGSIVSKYSQFSYAEVVSITNDFQKVIGKGGFGTVYYGYLNDNTEVAVKMLSLSSTQGSKEFQTEAQLLMRVYHRNLASFVGYCNEGSNMALINEYLANGNLQDYLTGENALSWEERLRIAVDAAQGLEYLHNGCKPPIVHRDVKTANILLDENLQGKIADFGLSKVFPDEGGTHVSTMVVGTTGYLDPEYYISNKLNEKSDVYSFGIVLLELITGLPAFIKTSSERIHIVQWVSPMLARGEIRNIADHRAHNFYRNYVSQFPPSSLLTFLIVCFFMANQLVSSTMNTTPLLPYSSMAIMLSIKLNGNNYLLWRNQILPLLESQELLGFIDGTAQQPFATMTQEDGTQVINPEHCIWRLTDRFVLSLINSSLTEAAMIMTMDRQNAFEVWTVLDESYAHKSKNQELQLREELQVIKRDSSSISDHLQKFRAICDQLLAIGSPVLDTNKAQLLMRVYHRNLTSFVGYCNEGSNMALIYEYLANGSLQNYLTAGEDVLSWEKRLRIAIDSAQGLEYLHTGCKPPIVHRDVKTANILLDDKWQGKIADFGLCKVFPNEGGTHVSTIVVGTTGYLDPEYYILNKLNEKSDVYSFGIVLLELITSQPAIIKNGVERIHIIQWVSPMLPRGEIRNIVDHRLQSDYNINSVWKAIETAMACVPQTSIRRPNMNHVLSELKECLALEMAHEKCSKINIDHEILSTRSFGMASVNHELEMGASSR